MSFSNEVKIEIAGRYPAMRPRLKKALAHGLFAFARRFDGEEMSIRSESGETVRLHARVCREIAGKEAALELGSQVRAGKTVHTARLTDGVGCLRLLEALGGFIPENAEETHILLAGAFLACGNVTDPEKGYHLEFVVRDKALHERLSGWMEQVAPGVKRGARRGADTFYYKDCAQIEDMLAAMGAGKASLAVIEVEIVKGVRNRANRATNCETANIDKLVRASAGQVEDIAFILREKGEDFLPEGLRQAALTRLANPELSLRELAEEMPVPVSRSGMYRRLDKLSVIAARLREGKGGEWT